MRRTFLYAAFVTVMAAAQAQQAPPQQTPAQQAPASGANLYSKEKEAALGAELARQLERTAPLVDNPDALKYVQQVAARLALQLPDEPFPYTFKLIGDSDIASTEPLSLPGGYIYVPTQLFLTARDESEFAGMLAHAMAHVAERHGTRQATRGALGQTATIPLIFYGGWSGFGTRPSSSVAMPVAFLRMSNVYEEQADAEAVKMAAAAGYDPEGLLRVLIRDQSTPAARLDALRSAIGAPAPSSNDEFLRLQQQLRNSSAAPRN